MNKQALIVVQFSKMIGHAEHIRSELSHHQIINDLSKLTQYKKKWQQITVFVMDDSCHSGHS